MVRVRFLEESLYKTEPIKAGFRQSLSHAAIGFL